MAFGRILNVWQGSEYTSGEDYITLYSWLNRESHLQQLFKSETDSNKREE